MTSSKWDKKFSSATEPGKPATMLLQNQHLLPETGDALDIACGLGSSTLFLAEHGLNTTAWDSSSVALEKVQDFAKQKAVTVSVKQVDLETPLNVEQQFDVITVCHYLYRPLCSFIIDSLKPGGLLFYQTFTQQKTTEEGPSNPAFLLEENELLKLFSQLSPVAYREERDCGNIDQGLRNMAYLVARKD